MKLESQVGCIGSATKILGNKWTPLIIRDLYDDPKRFCQLERSTGGINPRTLSQRLEELQDMGVISKVNECEYALTEKGRDLIPILRAMAAWGAKHHQILPKSDLTTPN